MFWMLKSIGVGAGKFLGVWRIFSEFSQIYPKGFCATFAYKCSPTMIMKTFFLVWPPEKSLHEFTNVGVRFWKSNHVGRYFWSDCQGFCPDFQELCPDLW